MEPLHIALLIGAGAVGGLIAGLVGVGGGIVFAPVLFFFFQARNVPPEVVTPLTLGSSLFCTIVASSVSARVHYRVGAVDMKTAGVVGAFSAAAAWLATRFMTTQPWYSQEVFKVVFGGVLIVAAARVIGQTLHPHDGAHESGDQMRRPGPVLAALLGAATGTVSTAAGVGGGIVMVPAFTQLLRFPMRRAVATSSAAIIPIALAGVLTYAVLGRSAPVPSWALGYVDIPEALFLAVPAAGTARLGAWAAHQIDTRWLKRGFGVFAILVALRLLWSAVAP